MKLSLIYYTNKLNIKAKSLEDYVNFVDVTKKKNKYFKVLF